jgi:predicted enzyme related to lactoylglutathione lyase
MGALAFSFVKIVVADLDAAERFYREALGLQLLGRSTAPDSDYAQEECFMGVPGAQTPQLLLIRYLSRPTPAPGEAWTGFDVSNLDETVTAVERGGGKLLLAAHDVPEYGLRVAVVADPEGHMIELTQMLG